MSTAQQSRFDSKLLAPAKPGNGEPWLFLVLPKAVSEKLPRRGRTTVQGNINGHQFQATLDPDGQLSHWLKVDADMLTACDLQAGDAVTVEITPLKKEPEPQVPADFQDALQAAADARAVWDSTTPLARLDWIHWIESAKQAKTRAKRINDACDMLAEGKKRVCCFDQSGFYSKSLSAPKAVQQR